MAYLHSTAFGLQRGTVDGAVTHRERGRFREEAENAEDGEPQSQVQPHEIELVHRRHHRRAHWPRRMGHMVARPDVCPRNSATSRARRARGGPARGRRFPARPHSRSRPWARACRRACCWSARRARARRCSPAPSPARRACRSSTCRARRSPASSSVSARSACARCSSKARRKKGGVIFIDELDALGGARGRNRSHNEDDRTLNQLLVEMDGFAPTEGVVVVGATNRPEDLDPRSSGRAASTAS
jgi:hypothetical protein